MRAATRRQTWIDLVETAYRTDETGRWLRDVVDTSVHALDRGLGVVGAIYAVRPGPRLDFVAMASSGCPEEVVADIARGNQRDDVGPQLQATYLTRTCGTLPEATAL